MNKKVNIGIIGAGKIVESIHLPVLLNLPGIHVKWIFDKDERRSNLLSRMYSIDALRGTLPDEKVEEVDVCLIAIPYGVRDEFIRKCAHKKKAVYIEKPFAVTLAEHMAYCDLFSPPDLAVGFQRRYYKYVDDIQYIISMQLFGKLNEIYFNQGYFQLKGGSGFMADARMSGGGVIIESAIHTLDQILQFTKATNVTVNEVHSLSRSGIDHDTKFTSTLSCGAVSIPIISHISNMRNLNNVITLCFENKNILFKPVADAKLYVTEKKGSQLDELKTDRIELAKSGLTVNAAFIHFWQDFIDAIQSRQVNKTNAVNSCLTTGWIEQVYKLVNHRRI